MHEALSKQAHTPAPSVPCLALPTIAPACPAASTNSSTRHRLTLHFGRWQANQCASRLLTQGLLEALLKLLRPRLLRTLCGTPICRGGGKGAAGCLLNAVSLSLFIPFGNQGERDAQQLVRLQQQLYSEGLVGIMLRALPLVEPEDREVAPPSPLQRAPAESPISKQPLSLLRPPSSGVCFVLSHPPYGRSSVLLYSIACR